MTATRKFAGDWPISDYLRIILTKQVGFESIGMAFEYTTMASPEMIGLVSISVA